jgi:hypothetical protein
MEDETTDLLVGSEIVKQMINNLCAENLDTNLVRILLCFLVNLYIEAEHDCVSVIAGISLIERN